MRRIELNCWGGDHSLLPLPKTLMRTRLLLLPGTGLGSVAEWKGEDMQGRVRAPRLGGILVRQEEYWGVGICRGKRMR